MIIKIKIITFSDFILQLLRHFYILRNCCFLKLKEHFNISIKISPRKHPSIRKTDIFVC